MTATNKTLGDIVAENPAAAKVLHRRGMDFCCGGVHTLEQASADLDLNPDDVIAEIETEEARDERRERWDLRPLDELIDHILVRYHVPLRAEIQRLTDLARRVEAAHAGKPDVPEGLADLLVQVEDAVIVHLAKEENILFPLIRAGRAQTAHLPVQMMILEHADHGRNLRRIRNLTSDLHAPDHACASWRELIRGLARLEEDLTYHIHLENNILFPRALAG
jgi:regulator of cell morphogenesis and NO signaling